MTIRYTEYTSFCPHCRHIIEESNTGLKMLGWYFLIFGTMFMALAWILAVYVLRIIYKADIENIGSPNCPSCKKDIRYKGKKEWVSFSFIEKKKWSFRGLFRLTYVLGGALILLSLFSLFLFSEHQSDRTIGLICLIITLIFIVVIGVISYLWYKYKNSQYIVMTKRSYSLVQKSKMRTNNNGIESPPIKIFNGVRTTLVENKKMSNTDERDNLTRLTELANLKEKGFITEQEFIEMKQKLLY